LKKIQNIQTFMEMCTILNSGGGSRQSFDAYEAEAEIEDLILETTAHEFELIDGNERNLSDSHGMSSSQLSPPSSDTSEQLQSSLLSSWSSKTNVLFASSCELIYPEIVVYGIIELTKTKLRFSFNREYYFQYQQHNVTQDHSKTQNSNETLSNLSAQQKIEDTENFKYWTMKFFSKKIRDRTWKVNSIVEIYSRRYLLNWTALEIFFDNNRSHSPQFISHISMT
jgi:hypothetical protein